MRAKSLSFDFEGKDDSVSATLHEAGQWPSMEGSKVTITIKGNWEMHVGNNDELRFYRIVKTKHGGYKLKKF